MISFWYWLLSPRSIPQSGGFGDVDSAGVPELESETSRNLLLLGVELALPGFMIILSLFMVQILLKYSLMYCSRWYSLKWKGWKDEEK